MDIQIIENGKKFIFFGQGIPSKGYKVYKFTDKKASLIKEVNEMKKISKMTFSKLNLMRT